MATPPWNSREGRPGRPRLQRGALAADTAPYPLAPGILMYDPRVIEEFARRLLKKAKSVVITCTLLGALFGALGGYGYGRSSYINDVVCRNRDNTSGWLAASDGTLEERYYYCPNWRRDLSALVTSARQLHEWCKYSSYGTANLCPGADTDSDGDCDSADVAQIQAWINAPTYDVRADADLDGDNDSADKTQAQSAPLGGAVLGWDATGIPGLHNRRGFAGYTKEATALIARRRALCSFVGSWLQRDPLVYKDGASVLSYALSSPLVFLDPLGLFALQGGSTVSGDFYSRCVEDPCGEGCQATCQDQPGFPWCGGCDDNGGDPDPCFFSDDDVDEEGNPLLGKVVCKDGVVTICINDAALGASMDSIINTMIDAGAGRDRARDIARSCVEAHENAHAIGASCSPGQTSQEVQGGRGEFFATMVEVGCLRASRCHLEDRVEQANCEAGVANWKGSICADNPPMSLACNALDALLGAVGGRIKK